MIVIYSWKCMAPNTSVLFDNVIPKINNCSTWARQLLTVQSVIVCLLHLNFCHQHLLTSRISYIGVSRIEVVMLLSFKILCKYCKYIVIIKI